MIRDTFDFAQEAIVQAFGDEVTYRVDGEPDSGVAISAVFGSGFERVQSGEIRVAARNPEISVRLDELAALGFAPSKGDELDVRGTSFEVATVQPDVEGVSATLRLKKVP